MWNASAVSAPPSTSAIGVAPRASAWASDSTTTTPPPSPRTNPSRSRSNGRLARVGLVVALAEGAHVAERGDPDREHRRLAAAGQDDVDLAGLDQPEGVVEGDDRRGAGRRLGHHRPGEAPLHRQHAGGHRTRQGGDRERADEARPAGVGRVRPLDDLLDPAAAGVDDDADTVLLLLGHGREVEAGVRHGLLPGRHREVDEAAHPAGHLGIHADARVEALHLGRDPHLEARRVEAGDRRDAGDPGLHVPPVRLEVIAVGHDGAEAGDDCATGGVLAGWHGRGSFDVRSVGARAGEPRDCTADHRPGGHLRRAGTRSGLSHPRWRGRGWPRSRGRHRRP